MGRKSLIAIGSTTFEVLLLLRRGIGLTEIARQKNMKPQSVNGCKNDLLRAGWVIQNGRGKYTLTESGEWFLKSIYCNPKIKEKLR